MNSTTKVFLLSLTCILLSCNNRNNNKNINENSTFNLNNMTLIEKVLSCQISRGADEKVMESNFPITTGQEDFEASIIIIDSILSKSGYKKKSPIDFENKVKNIFGETLFVRFADKRIIHFDIRDQNPKCNVRESESESEYFYQEGSELTGFHIDKEKQIISNFYYLPELIDYQKEYPQTAKLESKEFKYYDEYEQDSLTLLRWKDISELSIIRKQNRDLLIHRNKYLFNDSNASLTWLMINDADFLESLVKIFGYVQDKKLLKWVLDRNKFHYDAQENNLEDFSRILATRTCNGKLIFHKEVLDIMTENLNAEYLDQIVDYTRFLGSRDNNSEFTSTFSFSEKAELLANLLYWGEKLPKGEQYLQYEFQFMGAFYKFTNDRNKYDKEFEKQNYYNLLDFKELWENGKEVGDGTAYPGEYK